jgi:hypothetical protein
MVLVPFADSAAISKEIPAEYLGRHWSLSIVIENRPITTAL